MQVVRGANDEQLNDPSLLKIDVAYVDGEWVKAKSGKSFEVHGTSSLLSP
jgi:succinate-semialdehyde dehydrogenase/glutarate-semialdehyde dehydrogenase